MVFELLAPVAPSDERSGKEEEEVDVDADDDDEEEGDVNFAIMSAIDGVPAAPRSLSLLLTVRRPAAVAAWAWAAGDEVDWHRT